MQDPLALYRKYHLDRGDERLEMFTRVQERFAIQIALYPGSFVHLAPAFVIPEMVFIDSDRRAARFFADPQVAAYVTRRKTFPAPAQFRFHQADYQQDLPEQEAGFDLLISQYAGFVSQACKRYLRPGGYLLANNSHGDASMASLDPEFTLVAVLHRRGERFRLSERDLAAYFVPAKEMVVTREMLEQRRRGVGYRKRAFAYLFRKIAP